MATTFTDLLGDSLIEGDGSGKSGAHREVSTNVLEKKIVAIYFSAHWCGPCQYFTPKLAKCYEKAQSDLKDCFEVVFVSSDREQKAFDEYFQSMPWKAIPYSDRDRCKKLGEKFKVKSIPKLIVLLPDGRILTEDGRGSILDKGVEAIQSWVEDEKKPSKTPEEYTWPGISCNQCQMNPLIGQRYSCSTCDNFDLCTACKEKGHEHELKIVPQPLTTIGTLVWKGIDLKPGGKGDTPSTPKNIWSPAEYDWITVK